MFNNIRSYIESSIKSYINKLFCLLEEIEREGIERVSDEHEHMFNKDVSVSERKL